MDPAAKFHDLYKPGETGHGYYTLIGDGVNDDRNDGKLDKAHKGFKHETVTVELWVKHLEGKQGLGVVPIRLDGTVVWGAIDIDVYDGLDHARIAQQCMDLNLPLIVCKSKSGGAHLYIFFREPVSAAAVQKKLRDIAAMIGHGQCEIFPKQSKIVEGDKGSWINMPYFGALTAEGTTRYAVDPDGGAISWEEFMQVAHNMAQTADYLRAPGTSTKDKGAKKTPDVFPDGPPCLNILAQQGFGQGTRDNALLNIGIYCKKAIPGEGWKDLLEEANRKYIQPPLTSEDVAKTKKSLEKKEYYYQCKSSLLAPYCNPVACRMRKFGVSGGDGGHPVFGEMRVLLTDPPIFFWDVTLNGENFTLELTSQQTSNPRMFKDKVWEQLRIAVPACKQQDWDAVLNETRRERFETINVPVDATTEGQCWELIERFCTYNPADQIDEVLEGRPAVVEVEEGKRRVYFQLSALMKFLASNQFKEYKVQHLARVLRMRKEKDESTGMDLEVADFAQMRIKGRNVRVCSLPAYEGIQGGFDVPDAIKLDVKPF